MALVITLLALVVIAVIGYPLVGRQPGHKKDESEIVTQDSGRAMLTELEADYQAGILSQEEYDELTAGFRRREGRASATSASVDERIERSEREPRSAAESVSSTQRQPSGPRTQKCPKCRQPYRAGDRFCQRCGARLTGGGKR